MLTLPSVHMTSPEQTVNCMANQGYLSALWPELMLKNISLNTLFKCIEVNTFYAIISSTWAFLRNAESEFTKCIRINNMIYPVMQSLLGAFTMGCRLPKFGILSI